MSKHKLKVVVVGAGLGGLCLAQMLRSSGIEVLVFERDASPWDRPQGYRLHLDSDGIDALEAALPPDLHALFDATAMRVVDSTTIVDTSLAVQKRVPSNVHGGNEATAPAKHVNVNRATLRQILLSGLEDICKFGAALDHYESDADGVTAAFADGTNVRADLLVGADGIRSTVRHQRAPDAQIMDTGVRAIYGRIPIEAARRLVPPNALEDVFTVGSDARKVFFGLGPVVFPTRPEIAAAKLAPLAQLSKQDDYVVSIVGGRREHFGIDDAALRAASSVELQRLACELLKDWPANASAIPAHGDPTSFFRVEMNSSVPFTLDAPTHVTLLGDAIHAMTPTLGRGANLAMRDGASLGRHIREVAEGKRELGESLQAYEREMTSYSFDVVRQSARMGTRLMGQEPLPGH